MERKENNDKIKDTGRDSKIPPPDPETLNTTDPQENMEGPVSSSMHDISKAFDTNESRREANEKRDKNM